MTNTISEWTLLTERRMVEVNEDELRPWHPSVVGISLYWETFPLIRLSVLDVSDHEVTNCCELKVHINNVTLYVHRISLHKSMRTKFRSWYFCLHIKRPRNINQLHGAQSFLRS